MRVDWLAIWLSCDRRVAQQGCSQWDERYHQWFWTFAAMMVNAAVSNIRDARLPHTAFAYSERGDMPRTRKIRGIGEGIDGTTAASEAAESNQQ